MSDDARLCPGPGCEKHLDSYTFACKPHWAQVPRPIQRSLVAAWRMRSTYPNDPDWKREHEYQKKVATSYLRPLRPTTPALPRTLPLVPDEPAPPAARPPRKRRTPRP